MTGVGPCNRVDDIERGMMMFKRGKKIILASVVMISALGMAVIPAYAATRKKISSVTVKVESNVLPEVRFGEEEIEVEVKGGKCSYDYYDIENVGFEWMEDDVPEITIYLRADEGYYFSLTKASSVKLTGATYVKASKQDSSETLALRVKLPSLAESVGEMGEVTINTNGYAYWNDVRGAGSYEYRLYRNGEGVGASYMTTETPYCNMQSMMNRAGSYSVKVRGVNKLKAENKGKWGESNVISLSSEMAEKIRTGAVEGTGIPIKGEWKKDDTGWWYEHSDGSYTKGNWEEIKGQWYLFDEEGYMRTGWVEWNGEEYYCKEETGELLKNTTTPDGYILDENGQKKNR